MLNPIHVAAEFLFRLLLSSQFQKRSPLLHSLLLLGKLSGKYQKKVEDNWFKFKKIRLKLKIPPSGSCSRLKIYTNTENVFSDYIGSIQLFTGQLKKFKKINELYD